MQSKEVYRRLRATGQLCTECPRVEKKQSETSHPALQKPTGLPLASLSLPPGPHLARLSLWSVTLPPHTSQASLVMALAFSSACSDFASHLFRAGSLVLRNNPLLSTIQSLR